MNAFTSPTPSRDPLATVAAATSRGASHGSPGESQGVSAAERHDQGAPTRQDATAPPMLLTLNEVAAELRCARRSVERHIAAREIEVVRFGRCVRVERGELARFIASHTERMKAAADATSA